MLAIFTTAISFLGSPIGKIVGYGVAILAAILIIWGVIAYHDRQIAAKATAAFNQTQLIQITKDQKTYQKDTQQLKDNSDTQQSLLKKQQEVLDKKLADVNKKLSDEPKADQDKQSSQLLKDLFQSLSK